MSLITQKNWSLFANSIADPAKPEEYNQAAVNRLMDKMDDNIIRVVGVKPQYRAINKVQLIDFQNEEDRLYYQKAWDRYLAEKAKLEGEAGLSKAQSRFSILVQFLKFRQAAELCRAKYLAQAMYDSVNRNNKAAVAALNFRPTITKIVTILMNEYGVSRDDISLIWGGSQVKQTKKGKLKKTLIENDKVLEALMAEGIDLEDLDLGEDVEVKEEVHFDPSLRMGSQTKETRQAEIDNFQRGTSKYCFFTFKAGGVGLSLHHTDELTRTYNEDAPGFEQWYLRYNIEQLIAHKKLLNGQARRKESGYVYEEDIPYIYTRPRELYCAPTYSAIELVQGLGRCPRLTSLSDTLQLLVFFRGTIEEKVAYITSLKLRCLSKVIRQREHWEDVIIGRDSEAAAKQLIETSEPDGDEDSGLEILGSDINDDE